MKFPRENKMISFAIQIFADKSVDLSGVNEADATLIALWNRRNENDAFSIERRPIVCLTGTIFRIHISRLKSIERRWMCVRVRACVSLWIESN